MKSVFISRIFWRLSPSKAMDSLRSTALAEWQDCFDRGAAPDASAIDRSFHRIIVERTDRLKASCEPAQLDQSLSDMRMYTWAAHYAPVEVFSALQVLTAQAFAKSQDAVDAVRYGMSLTAEKDVEKLRQFPQPQTGKAKPKPPGPKLESVDARQAREAWRQSPPLVTCDSPPEEIERVLAGFTAGDLHALAHGEDLVDAPLAEAIARHPACDWGSACEILHSYSASVYQGYWAEGRSEDAFSENERCLFRAFAVIADRAGRGGFATRRFAHNWQAGKPTRPDGKPNTYHPTHWVKWRIPEDRLLPTSGERHRPSVMLDCGKVRLTFEAWQRQRA